MKKLSPRFILWLKRLGIAGFLFFLVKGLLWLAVIFFGIELFDGC